MSREAYMAGFAAGCARLGVDMGELVKLAEGGDIPQRDTDIDYGESFRKGQENADKGEASLYQGQGAPGTPYNPKYNYQANLGITQQQAEDAFRTGRMDPSWDPKTKNYLNQKMLLHNEQGQLRDESAATAMPQVPTATGAAGVGQRLRERIGSTVQMLNPFHALQGDTPEGARLADGTIQKADPITRLGRGIDDLRQGAGNFYKGLTGQEIKAPAAPAKPTSAMSEYNPDTEASTPYAGKNAPGPGPGKAAPAAAPAPAPAPAPTTTTPAPAVAPAGAPAPAPKGPAPAQGNQTSNMIRTSYKGDKGYVTALTPRPAAKAPGANQAASQKQLVDAGTAPKPVDKNKIPGMPS